MVFEQRHEDVKERHVIGPRKSVPGRRHNQHKGPEQEYSQLVFTASERQCSWSRVSKGSAAGY